MTEEEPVFFISSEFDVFAKKPVQRSVLETTEVVYKPLAPVEQNDLEFVIPADPDTYIFWTLSYMLKAK
jgi:hypothetical protein